MNTNKIPLRNEPELPVHNLYNEEPLQAVVIGSSDNTEDSIVMHEAKIITPQPYGVFALCKIVEHLQIN